jgi:hypothetical protein
MGVFRNFRYLSGPCLIVDTIGVTFSSLFRDIRSQWPDILRRVGRSRLANKTCRRHGSRCQSVSSTAGTPSPMSVTDPILYRVVPERPEAHLFSVELSIPTAPGTAPGAPLTLSLPAWIPGSYMIRDFARNVVSISAEDASGSLPLTKLDKQTWTVTPRGASGVASGADSGGYAGPVTVRYQVYAWELTVRSAHLDRTHGYFNGPSLFLRVHGRDRSPCRVELVPPSDPACAHWRVATSMARDKDRSPDAGRWGFGWLPGRRLRGPDRSPGGDGPLRCHRLPGRRRSPLDGGQRPASR